MTVDTNTFKDNLHLVIVESVSFAEHLAPRFTAEGLQALADVERRLGERRQSPMNWFDKGLEQEERARDRRTPDIQWAAHLTDPNLPTDAELREQERARRQERQAGRFDELKEMLR